MTKPKTTMAFAVHHNRFGFVFLIGKQPMDWQLTHKSADMIDQAKAKAAAWINYYNPDVVLTEDLAGSERKGYQTQMLISAISEVASASRAQHRFAMRHQPFANKYDQIDALCETYPQMRVIRPEKRKFYDAEPPYVTIFEALGLAIYRQR